MSALRRIPFWVQIVAGLYPDMHPFDPRGANEAGFPWEKDYTRIRPEYFDAADARLQHLVDQGLTPCIVGAWGYYMPWMGVEKLNAHWRYLIARYGAKVDVAKAPPATPRGARRTRAIKSVKAVALKADKAKARDFWSDVTSRTSASGSKLEKLWLDRKLSASLDRSTAQVGAPQAWANGLTGGGTTVAVLDTGADDEHPDLVGRIAGSQDFTGSWGGALDDVDGHGTHTASTVGGSGAASDGSKKGVAPGTDLLIGKVLDDSGFGAESWIIAGMEWAVGQGADVVSMSLGSSGPPGDCTDPIATAAQNLSTSSTSLFVIAAGNTGPANDTVSSPACAPAALSVGAVDRSERYMSALDLLAALRLCSNVPGQWAVQTALGGFQSITKLCSPGGRLYQSRAAIIKGVAQSRYLSLVEPRGSMYAFIGVDKQKLPGFDDESFAMELLEQQHVLIAPGSSFNTPYRDHFRITTLPEEAKLAEVFQRIEHVLEQIADRPPRLETA